MESLIYPSLYQVNTRIWLNKLTQSGKKVTLGNIPDYELNKISDAGFDEHPDYYVNGTEVMMAQASMNFTKAKSKYENLILVFGRDPYFAGWPDTLIIFI